MKKSHYEITNLRKLRAAFWRECPDCAVKRKPGSKNSQVAADVRMTFVDWLDSAERGGRVSSKLANRETL